MQKDNLTDLLNQQSRKIGLKGIYKIEVVDKLNGCAKPSILERVIKFDGGYLAKLNEKEFTAVATHELAHIKIFKKVLLTFFAMVVFIILLNFYFVLSWKVISIFVILIYISGRKLFKCVEFQCDELALKHKGLYNVGDLISGLRKSRCVYREHRLGFIFKKYFMPHPKMDERIARLRELESSSKTTHKIYSEKLS